MSHFIKLTQSNLHHEPAHGQKVYVNMDLVTEFCECTGHFSYTMEQRQLPMADREVVRYTLLSFAAGFGEGNVLSTTVIESTEEIAAAVNAKSKESRF